MLEFLLPLFHCFQLAFPLIVFTIRCGLVVPFQICDLYLERLGFSFHHTNKGTFLHSAHATRLMTGFFKTVVVLCKMMMFLLWSPSRLSRGWRQTIPVSCMWTGHQTQELLEKTHGYPHRLEKPPVSLVSLPVCSQRQSQVPHEGEMMQAFFMLWPCRPHHHHL